MTRFKSRATMTLPPDALRLLTVAKARALFRTLRPAVLRELRELEARPTATTYVQVPSGYWSDE